MNITWITRKITQLKFLVANCVVIIVPIRVVVLIGIPLRRMAMEDNIADITKVTTILMKDKVVCLIDSTS